MKYYQQVTGYNQSVIDFTISVNDVESGFSVAAGLLDSEYDSPTLLYTGFAFSGYNGYVFDSQGDFVGGYSLNKPFNIVVKIDDNSQYSYFINNVLIANNLTGNYFDCIEFDKHLDSSLLIQHDGNINDLFYNDALQDFSGNFLFSSDNILLLPN